MGNMQCTIMFKQRPLGVLPAPALPLVRSKEMSISFSTNNIVKIGVKLWRIESERGLCRPLFTLAEQWATNKRVGGLRPPTHRKS